MLLSKAEALKKDHKTVTMHITTLFDKSLWSLSPQKKLRKILLEK